LATEHCHRARFGNPLEWLMNGHLTWCNWSLTRNVSSGPKLAALDLTDRKVTMCLKQKHKQICE
jgi:hypothetical protein